MTSDDTPRDYHLVAEDGVPSAEEMQREWNAARQRRLERMPAASTIAAAEYLIRIGDPERLKRWLETHPKAEQTAIANYFLKRRSP
jgi:hypothetical protein